jgi:hypothetical protein
VPETPIWLNILLVQQLLLCFLNIREDTEE